MKVISFRFIAVFVLLFTAKVSATVRYVDVNSASPASPYTDWSTAATNIQDAIDASTPGDTVLVTNGVYATGGKVISAGFTNRVALDKALLVASVNGYAATVIQGAWDPVSTNGPGAVRCAYLVDGAMLSGFTLQNGATTATGDGGGVACVSKKGIVSNCLLVNNRAANHGGGISQGTLNNSLVISNSASQPGGGAYFTELNNCTLVNNYIPGSTIGRGAGIYAGTVRNSVVVNNYEISFPSMMLDNYSFGPNMTVFTNSCTSPAPFGTSNVVADPQFVDAFHISTTSPCRGMGSPIYASGTDLDGEPWTNPPSMGCDEVIDANLTGPLSVNMLAAFTNLFVNHADGFTGITTGRVAQVQWSFGDLTTNNPGSVVFHTWTNTGDYTVTFAAFNNDNPAGVSTSTVVHVQPIPASQLQLPMLQTNGFQFQFTQQAGVFYTIQYATNLSAPVTWYQLGLYVGSGNSPVPVTDSAATNGARFYRVLAH